MSGHHEDVTAKFAGKAPLTVRHADVGRDQFVARPGDAYIVCKSTWRAFEMSECMTPRPDISEHNKGKINYKCERDFAECTKTEAKRRLAEGWREVADEMYRMAQTMHAKLPNAEDVRRRLVWREDGDYLDLDRALAGYEESMFLAPAKRKSVAPPVVRLAIPWGGSCVIRDMQLRWQAVAGLVTAHLLEEAGFLVEIEAMDPVYMRTSDAQGHEVRCVSVALKEAGDPMAPDFLAGVSGGAGVFRWYGLGAMANSAKIDCGWGYGFPINVDDYMVLAREAGIEPDDAIVVPRAKDYDTAVKSVTEAIKLVEDHLNHRHND